VHVRYDPELGWVNVPDLYLPDMYGPRIWLRINAQGFRNDRNFSRDVPRDRVRLICSGDSFTLGYGVANDQAWCNHLETLDSRLEAVNMGQGGYGVDQSYLWFKRDGAVLDHDVHLFAFIALDFERMRNRSFLGYQKPTLTLEDGHLAVRNVPVPRISTFRVGLGRLARVVNRTQMAALYQRIVRRLSPPPSPPTRGSASDPLRPVVEGVFESLRQLADRNGSLLVLVYLPTRSEREASAPSPWRSFVHDVAARLGIPLVDLTPDLAAVADGTAPGFFIRSGELQFFGAEGHYSARGNRFVAEALLRRLRALDPVSARLGGS
jgi:hypothetical protein